jgi:hypothetical protein
LGSNKPAPHLGAHLDPAQRCLAPAHAGRSADANASSADTPLMPPWSPLPHAPIASPGPPQPPYPALPGRLSLLTDRLPLHALIACPWPTSIACLGLTRSPHAARHQRLYLPAPIAFPACLDRLSRAQPAAHPIHCPPRLPPPARIDCISLPHLPLSLDSPRTHSLGAAHLDRLSRPAPPIVCPGLTRSPRGPPRSSLPACPDCLSRPATLTSPCPPRTPFAARLDRLSWPASNTTHYNVDRPSRPASTASPGPTDPLTQPASHPLTARPDQLARPGPITSPGPPRPPSLARPTACPGLTRPLLAARHIRLSRPATRLAPHPLPA